MKGFETLMLFIIYEISGYRVFNLHVIKSS